MPRPVPDARRCTHRSGRARCEHRRYRPSTGDRAELDVCWCHSELTEPADVPADEQRCTGRSKSRCNARCIKPRLLGLEVCATHGGSTDAAQAKHNAAVADAHARKAVARLGAPTDVDPQTALLHVVQTLSGHESWLRQQLAQTTEEDLGIAGTAAYGVWRDVLRDLARASSEAIRGGVAERQVRLAEAQGALIADVLRRVFNDPLLGLTPDQKRVAQTLAGRTIRALPSPAAAVGE